MFQNYSISQAERFLIIKSRLGRQGMQLLESLTLAEQEVCNTEEVLFETLNKKFKPKYNQTTKSLQFYKLMRQTNKNTEEWMGRTIVVAIECNYKEFDRHSYMDSITVIS